ncbi:hypothetical protein [Azospirillum rugosum]|uniref:Uncharacterized protein n=1 Tax=Azospirillum rugosum TaxID=416170 RepID=A0ABS4SDU9_9PROT|nr:hypothetical protein [Azospirillum rugosum]MBP2290758.1 hypothetical protein [Azospirillum rugosum]MDQ0525647.1 hypothetical protein [Azospirillum rugosum]
MPIEITPHPNSVHASIWDGGRIIGSIETKFAHLIQGAVLVPWPGLPASMVERVEQRGAPLTLSELEAMDDSAHTSGRAKAVERAARYEPPADPEVMAQRWRERAERHRNTSFRMARICRWLAANPEVTELKDTELGTFNVAGARKELAYQHAMHIAARGQEAFWLRQAQQQATEPAALPALPPAANDETQAAGKVA